MSSAPQSASNTSANLHPSDFRRQPITRSRAFSQSPALHPSPVPKDNQPINNEPAQPTAPQSRTHTATPHPTAQIQRPTQAPPKITLAERQQARSPYYSTMARVFYLFVFITCSHQSHNGMDSLNLLLHPDLLRMQSQQGRFNNQKKT